MRRLLCALFCVLSAQGTMLAQDASTVESEKRQPASGVQVLPAPKQLQATGAQFPLKRTTRVVLAERRSEDDRFAAEDFIADVRDTAGVTLRAGAGSGGRGQIFIGPLEHARIRSALERAGVAVPQNLNEEGYVLSVTANEVVVAAPKAAGVFYGMQTLKQLVRGEGAGAFLQGVQIVDWPSMRWRGVSDDISRGPVPTLEYIKRQLRTFAFFKMNMHSFYMEHAFSSRTHPLIGPEGGSLTPEEIRELVAYARRYHIELVPEQQTFGHLHKALKLEKYNELAETPHGDVLSPEVEGSYKLVADWYRELGELFPGQFFHIGADETFELGQGRSREAVRQRGVGAVYFEHLRRVRDILQPYNRRLMFWGDIALNHPELINQIPRDMIVMNWAYGTREPFAARINLFKNAGLEQFVCPGVQSWTQIFPNTEAAVTNIRTFVQEGQAAGVLGMMNTQWDDDGESLFETTWYPIVFGAAAAWQKAPLDTEQFDRNFDWAFFRREGDELTRSIRALGSVNSLLGIGASDDVFWRDPFTDTFQHDRVRPLLDKVRQMRLRVEAAEETVLRARTSVRRNREALDAMRFAAQRLDHLGRKIQTTYQFSRDYWDAYLNIGDRAKVRRLRRYTSAIYNAMREQAEELSILRAAYREQWLRENRPYWLDSILARYDLAISRWLTRSKELEEILRLYEQNSTLPSPDTFGLGDRPEEPEGTRNN